MKGGLAFPVGYYSDGAPRTKKDSFIAFSSGNFVASARRTIAIARKSDACQCGCRGMCTLAAVMRIIV
eukprot:8172080-Pyramimonas_sp.AAC.1